MLAGDPAPLPPNESPPKSSIVPCDEATGLVSVLPASDGPLPNIETKSSRGLLEVPARRFAAAGVCEKTSVAARPEGCPLDAGASSKSLMRMDR